LGRILTISTQLHRDFFLRPRIGSNFAEEGLRRNKRNAGTTLFHAIEAPNDRDRTIGTGIQYLGMRGLDPDFFSQAQRHCALYIFPLEEDWVHFEF
jgi:hypothetical protein